MVLIYRKTRVTIFKSSQNWHFQRKYRLHLFQTETEETPQLLALIGPKINIRYNQCIDSNTTKSHQTMQTRAKFSIFYSFIRMTQFWQLHITFIICLHKDLFDLKVKNSAPARLSLYHFRVPTNFKVKYLSFFRLAFVCPNENSRTLQMFTGCSRGNQSAGISNLRGLHVTGGPRIS